MQRRTCKYLYDILRSAEAIQTAVLNRTLEDYNEDIYLRLAIERLFEIIGEALNQMARIDPETAERFSNYQEIIGFRNFLIHSYQRIDNEIVWRAAVEDTPTLIRQAGTLIDECGGR